MPHDQDPKDPRTAGHLPDPWTWAGASVVIGSGIYVFSRERYLRRVGRL